MKYDLHVHSVYSDGRLTPSEICAKVKDAELDGFALTDHDTVAGLDVAAAAAKDADLRFIPGIEVSAFDGCEVHILGLNIKHKSHAFLSALSSVRNIRGSRNREILKKLAGLGIVITERDIAKDRAGSSGRQSIASAMLSKNYVQSIAEAFDRYLAEGRPAYCGVVAVPPEKAIALIHAGKGKAFLAHPVRLHLDDESKLCLAKRLVGIGLDGIEAYYPMQGEILTGKLLAFAKENKLLLSGGTDNHGSLADAPFGNVVCSLPF